MLKLSFLCQVFDNNNLNVLILEDLDSLLGPFKLRWTKFNQTLYIGVQSHVVERWTI